MENNDFFENLKVVKRNGKKVNFDTTKVAIAIKKGFDGVGRTDDEEEKYYIKYKVTAKTEGSGWIKQVNIKVDGRSVKTGNPKNEGESFTYIGSKTYKNKSELPTISCEGILINGAGNIQSSPGSISVASQVP